MGYTVNVLNVTKKNEFVFCEKKNHLERRIFTTAKSNKCVFWENLALPPKENE